MSCEKTAAAISLKMVDAATVAAILATALAVPSAYALTVLMVTHDME